MRVLAAFVFTVLILGFAALLGRLADELEHRLPDPMTVLYQLAFGYPVEAEELPSAAPEPLRGSIVFTTLHPANRDLFVLGAGGTSESLTDSPALDVNPALSPDGRWLVFASERGGTMNLWAKDLEGSGAEIQLTRSRGMDDAPTVSPDGKTLAFVSNRDGKAGIYTQPFRPEDPSSEAQARLLTAQAGGEFRPAYSPDGSRIAFSSHREATPEDPGTQIYVMQADGTGAVRLTSGPGWNGSPAWSVDGKTLYFQRSFFAPPPAFVATESRIWKIGADGSGVEAVSPEGTFAAWPTLGHEGELAYCVREGDREDTAWSLVAGGKTLGPAEQARAIPGSGRWIVSAPGPDEAVGAAGSAEPPRPFLSPTRRQRLSGPYLDVELQPVLQPFPAPSPDRTSWLTAFRSIDASRLDGRQHHSLYAAQGGGHGWGVWSPKWSPDGASIVFAAGPGFAPPDAPVKIMKMAADGSALVDLTEGIPGNHGFPDISPDGRQIVFRSGRDGNQEIYLMAADGSRQRRLTRNQATDTMPAFSPSGDQIAFVSNRDGNFELYTLDLKEAATEAPNEGPALGALRRITASPGHDTHPRYSPDGRWLVFTTARWGFSDEHPFGFHPQPFGELAAVRLEDLLTVRLTYNQWEDGLAVWLGEDLDTLMELSRQPVADPNARASLGLAAPSTASSGSALAIAGRL